MHINPDHYLETAQGRVFTDKRNIQAWQKCFDDLKHTIQTCKNIKRLYLLIGAQASGKSTWAKLKNIEEPENIIFDVILVKRVERQKVIQILKDSHVAVVAVVFNTPLAVCLERNAQRSLDTRVNETALKNVYAAMELPMLVEGFIQIVTVN
jgi:predicted kinase